MVRFESRIGETLRDFGAGVLDLLYPRQCLLCRSVIDLNEADGDICAACREDFVIDPALQCQRCGGPVGPGLSTDVCVNCRNDRFAFERTFACAQYVGESRAAVLSAKKGHDAALATSLARVMADRLPGDGAWDLIVPVPTHWQTRLLRPTHLADSLAEMIARLGRWPVDLRLLRKVRATAKQAKLSGTERRKNLRGAFEASANVDGARVLLVDDVLTTGATASECARALRAAGAASVEVVVFARRAGEVRSSHQAGRSATPTPPP